MIKKTEAEGRTIEEAIESGLGKLGTTRDNVEIEIIERESKGMFGFGGKPAKVLLSMPSDAESEATKFLSDIFDAMGISVDIRASVDGNNIAVELAGDNMGVIIGRRGETLDALQYLTSLAINKTSEEYYRVSIDTENYRAEREAALISLAKRLASKAKRNRRSVSLEPMNAYERKVIHTALQDDNEISTYSLGDEPNRKVVITVKSERRSRV